MSRPGALCQVDEGWVGAMRVGCLGRSVGRLGGNLRICSAHLKKRGLCAAAGSNGALCGRAGVASRADGLAVCVDHRPGGSGRGRR
jgi:hypothetical protein